MGFTAFAAAYALFLRARPSMPYADAMLPTMLLLGTGFGLSFAALNAQATSGVDNNEQGLASGLFNTSLQVGGAVVLAVVTAIVSGTGSAAVPGRLLPGMTTAIWVVVAINALALIATAVRVAGQRRPFAAAVPAPAPCLD